MGQYGNIGCVRAIGDSADCDPSHYNAPPPGLTLEKATNGFDADLVTDPQAQLAVGDPVEWTYVVTNSGQTQLTLAELIDDSGTPAPPPATTSTS